MRYRVGLPSLIAALLLSLTVVGLGPPATPGVANAQPADLPRVSMEATVKAAQIDPQRADDTLTPGARSSVIKVERALRSRGMLEARWVDGYFGTATVAAYQRFQRSLGYRGLDANGLPGLTSLTRLGQDRFRVVKPLNPGARDVVRDSMLINARTDRMLGRSEERLGLTLRLDQGSYNPGGDPTSAGTHDGGGVVDISVETMDTATRQRVVRGLRRVGFAAWLRSPQQGNWPWHIHAVAISDTDLSSQAQHQVGDYYLGLNGLANGRPDDGPRVPIRTWEEFLRR